MYTLMKRPHDRTTLLLQGTSFASSIVIAEVFYKFHSFTLECLAFLATWYAIDFAVAMVRRPTRAT